MKDHFAKANLPDSNLLVVHSKLKNCGVSALLIFNINTMTSSRIWAAINNESELRNCFIIYSYYKYHFMSEIKIALKNLLHWLSIYFRQRFAEWLQVKLS